MKPGFVEGFYGPLWSHEERLATADFMAAAGFEFFLYAPKGDGFLRRRWRERWPEYRRGELLETVAHFRSRGARFGVGLSPEAGDAPGVLAKVEEIASLGVDHVALLFDDMRGDAPGLARSQLALAHSVRERFPALGMSLCPTYYSLDPVLDRLFGPRPAGYLEELGANLDSSIELFWTGERICSREYPAEHLRQVGRWFQRPPLLWDNYPVNDTVSMSLRLHLRPFTSLPAPELISGRLVNPMLQPVLSRIPSLTLVGRTLEQAAREVLGEELGALLLRDVEQFQDRGADPARRADYARHDHPGAREVVRWLDGQYAVTPELVAAQQ